MRSEDFKECRATAYNTQRRVIFAVFVELGYRQK